MVSATYLTARDHMQKRKAARREDKGEYIQDIPQRQKETFHGSARVGILLRGRNLALLATAFDRRAKTK